MNVILFGCNLWEWVFLLLVFLVFIVVFLLSVGENLNFQFNKFGNQIWLDYLIFWFDVFMFFCDLDMDIDFCLQEIIVSKQKEVEDDFFGGMFGDVDINEEVICILFNK